MVAGDEHRFVGNCNSAMDLIKAMLRSNGVKQGVSLSGSRASLMFDKPPGLETLIKKQDHFRNSFMDFATVAIFFSSVTATTLQFSYQSADSTVSSTIVNLCWFASLVLSIASATNSLLGVLVHQSPEYLRPSRSLDFRFLQNWFKFVPPMLLTCSGVLFLVGFCGFTFLSTSSFPSQVFLFRLPTTCNWARLIMHPGNSHQICHNSSNVNKLSRARCHLSVCIYSYSSPVYKDRSISLRCRSSLGDCICTAFPRASCVPFHDALLPYSPQKVSTGI